jgi:putative oxidoreductase
VLETFGGALLLVGLWTRPVAFILSGEMAFAYFIGHAPQRLWPVINQGAARSSSASSSSTSPPPGPGPWSVDAPCAAAARIVD